MESPQSSAAAMPSLFRWIEMVLALSVLLVPSAGFLFWRNARKLDGAEHGVERTQQVLLALDDVLGTLQDAETGQRGFLITGRDRYLQPYERATVQAIARIAALRALTADNPEQQELIARLETHTKAKLSELAQTVAVRKSSSFRSAQELVLTDVGEKEMQAIRTIVADIRRNAEAHLLRREERTQERYQTMLITSVASAAGTTELLALSLILLVRFGAMRRQATECRVRAEMLSRQLVDQRMTEVQTERPQQTTWEPLERRPADFELWPPVDDAETLRTVVANSSTNADVRE